MQDSDNKLEPEAGSMKQVGYRNPPAVTQFKKGQSGNPKGRPKGVLNASTVLAQTLREKVVVNENGRRKTITKWNAAFKQIVNKAASGDLRAFQLVMMLEAKTCESQRQPNTKALNESDKKIMESIVKRFQTGTDDQGRK
jgi:hypothetical protein